MNDVHVEFKSKLKFLIGSIQLLVSRKLHVAKFRRKTENTHLEDFTAANKKIVTFDFD